MYNTHSMSQSSAGLVISFVGASGETGMVYFGGKVVVILLLHLEKWVLS